MNSQSIREDHYQISCPRPVELYVFIDPLCPSCWSLQPILRRLQVEYEQYFTLRVALRTSLKNLNINANPSCRTPYCENSNPSFPSLAIKAAEFQGKRAGFRFLSKLLDYTFSQSKNISSFDVLLEVAEDLHLDVDEFVRDFKSQNALRNLQIDLFLASEMGVSQAPTFVFFNENIEDAGLKIDGLYDYEVYVQVLSELIPNEIFAEQPPAIELLLNRFEAMTTEEIATIYNRSLSDTERELKKKVLLQKIERLTVDQATYWRLKKDQVVSNYF